MLEARSLALRYGDFEAVRNISFTVRSGEILALIGQNGAGKSSTINMLTGILPPTSGEVWVGGKCLTRDALDVRRQVGYVPDRPDIYEYLTLREYLRFVGGLYGMRRREVEAAAEPLITRFRLEDETSTLLGAFSHGMRQKAVLIGALVPSPSVLILDEPIVGLDPVSTRILLDVLAERAAGGTAVVFSTHLLSLAVDVASRIVIVHRGEVRAAGTLAEVVGDVALADGRASDADLEAAFFRLIGESAGEERAA